ncbi:MAG: hypothetical protein WA988_02170 [Candidatus Nanopelagicales bacterium]
MENYPRRTYVEVGIGGFVNADLICAIRPGGGMVTIALDSQTHVFHGDRVSKSSASLVAVELLRELGQPAIQNGTRIITYLDQKVVSRYLD